MVFFPQLVNPKHPPSLFIPSSPLELHLED